VNGRWLLVTHSTVGICLQDAHLAVLVCVLAVMIQVFWLSLLGLGAAACCLLPQVLDMCAAPGSKTFQLLEMLHDMDSASKGSGSASTPGGFVVANDADAQRCNLLTHQTKRMCSPCLMITNHYGEQFPAISSAALDSAAAAVAATARGEGGSSDQAAAAAAAAAAAHSSNKSVDIMLFDRILCDVPCSGDGTMRKAPDIWRRWSVHNGNGLHCMQLKIALQAVRLLKVTSQPVCCLLGCIATHPQEGLPRL